MGTTPYVSPAEFMAYPNYLDLNDLIPGGTGPQQSAELNNALLRVTGMARSYCRQPLGAETLTDVRVARYNPLTGTVPVKPSARPLIRIKAVTLLPYALPGGQPVSIDPTTVPPPIRGLLQIPARGLCPTGPSGQIQATITYEAGYPCTVLAVPAAAAAPQITVTDPTGLMPGTPLRIWDPGAEEATQVGPAYLPGNALVPLATPLLDAHAAGAAIDNLPGDAREAVILWTMGVLARPTSGGDMDAFADSHGDGPLTTGSDPRRTGAGLIRSAREMLDEGGHVKAW